MAQDSLSRRLAGQSVNKAGLGHDQSEVNRIIMEASKGSKFYEAERRKDAELTEKIDRLLAQHVDLMKTVEIARVEMSADHTLAELEAERDLSQVICHIDCDAFYASVEVLDDPSLAGKPFGVGHGVLSTASYEARKFGVRSAMPGFIAKKLCPSLIFVDHHFDRYVEMSRQVMDVLRLRDPNLAKMSLDEAYLNITEYCETHELSPEECVEQMRAEVEEKTKLTVSAGIAPNKMLAKICSDKNKPNGQYMMPFEKDKIMAFMAELPIRKVPGIGKVSERMLESFGIRTCGDIYAQRVTISVMDHYLGLHSLLKAYLGIAGNVVQPGRREETKSVGAETTFQGTADHDTIMKKLEHVATSLAEDLESHGFAGKTITLKYKLDTYKLYTKAKTCDRYITSKEDLFAIGKEIYGKVAPLKLRLIGLRATQLKDLRVSDDTGIKKFFTKSANDNPNTTSPPAKKRRLDKEPSFIMISDGSDEEEASDSDPREAPAPTTKPSFFDPGSDDLPAESDSTAKKSSRPSSSSTKLRVKPASTGSAPSLSQQRTEPDFIQGAEGGASSSSRNPVVRGASENPQSTSKQSRSIDTFLTKVPAKPKKAPPRKTQMLLCPICQRQLQTDNAGLNEHIDFCLSKAEIRKVSAEGAGGSVKPKEKARNLKRK